MNDELLTKMIVEIFINPNTHFANKQIWTCKIKIVASRGYNAQRHNFKHTTVWSLFPLQVRGWGHRGEPEHARGPAHGPRAVWRAGPQEVAVRRVVQRCHPG